MSLDIVHVTPWPVKPFKPCYPNQLLPLPRSCKFVCAYTVDVGIDLIEEAIYFDQKLNRSPAYIRLMVVSALGLPRELDCAQTVIKQLKKDCILQCGEMIKVLTSKYNNILPVDMFRIVLKKRSKFDRPKDFIAGKIIKKREFNLVLKELKIK